MRPTQIRDFNMKKRFHKLALLTLLIGVFTSTGCMPDEWFPKKGNGKIITYEKTVSSFEKINGYGSEDIRFHASEEYQVEITVDENLREYVDIYVKNNELYIQTKKKCRYSFTKFTVDVYCPSLNGVSIRGSGKFETMDVISTSTFQTTISGSGRIEGTVECENFSGKISGSGKITLAGSSKNARLEISGSGKFNGEEHHTRTATIDIEGSGNANVWATDHLKATISGSGNVKYIGEPTIKSKVKGSGKIKKMS